MPCKWRQMARLITDAQSQSLREHLGEQYFRIAVAIVLISHTPAIAHQRHDHNEAKSSDR